VMGMGEDNDKGGNKVKQEKSRERAKGSRLVKASLERRMWVFGLARILAKNPLRFQGLDRVYRG